MDWCTAIKGFVRQNNIYDLINSICRLGGDNIKSLRREIVLNSIVVIISIMIWNSIVKMCTRNMIMTGKFYFGCNMFAIVVVYLILASIFHYSIIRIVGYVK